ncbi:MAG: hypothetical protein SGPRY_002104, partial [Prymnesium sp.]
MYKRAYDEMGIADPTSPTDTDLGRIKAWASAVAGCDGLEQMRSDWQGRSDDSPMVDC